MADETNPILFFSHSSLDKKKTDVIFEAFKDIWEQKYTVIYTSHKDGRLPFGANLVKSTVGKIKNSKVFLAYISENYINSPICMAEWGAAYSKNLYKSNDFEYIVINDKNLSPYHPESLATGDLTLSADNYKMLVSEIIARLKINDLSEEKTADIERDLYSEFESVYKGYVHDFEIYTGELYSFISKFPSLTKMYYNSPWIAYIFGKTYKSISEKLIQLGDEKIYWTLSNPLKVQKEYFVTDKLLTSYDEMFRDIDQLDKVRLIIFENESEQKQYNSGPSGESLLRRNAFEEANQDCLYCSVWTEIVSKYNIRHNSDSIDITYEDFSNYYLEFGYLKSADHALLFFSHIKKTDQSEAFDTTIHQVVFLNPVNSREYEFYNKYLSDSIRINKFIIDEFNYLCEIKIVEKIGIWGELRIT